MKRICAFYEKQEASTQNKRLTRLSTRQATKESDLNAFVFFLLLYFLLKGVFGSSFAAFSGLPSLPQEQIFRNQQKRNHFDLPSPSHPGCRYFDCFRSSEARA